MDHAAIAIPDAQTLEKRNFLSNIAKPSFSSSADARRKYDQEWLGRNLFWRGYQFSRYLPQTQTVVLAVRQSARIPVNLTAAYMRSIRNQVTAFRPKFEVLPTVPNNDSSSTQARYAQRLLDYYFDHLKLKMKIKETIVQALMYSIGGPWQIVYDELTKEVKIWLLDPFDFYMDPLAEDPNECEYMIKAVRSPLGAVTSNQNYDLEARQEIKGGSEILAASPQKQFLLQSIRVISPKMQTSSPFVILYEGSFRRYHEDGTRYMVHCIWTEQSTIPLLYEELETDEFDYVVYRGDLVPKEPYGESWLKHVMVINRAINTLESSALEYNSRIAKGRLVVDRDAGIRAIHNVHGEIISKNRGSEIKSLEMAPLPSSVQEQIARFGKYAMDIAGVHEACVTPDTEILTKVGWKKFDEIMKDEKIVSYDLKKDLLVDDIVKKVNIYVEKERTLVQIKNKNIDALVTSDHRWPIRNDVGKLEFKTTNELRTHQSLILSANSEFPKKAIFSDDFVELVGWTVTEGCYSQGPKNEARGRCKIRICQSKKHLIECNLIESCLRRLGCYTVPGRMKDGMLQFGYSGDTARKMRELFPDKKLTFDFITKLTEQQANILYKTLLLGDGTEIGPKTLFWSTDIENIDGFQYLCTLLGFNSRVSLFKRTITDKVYSFMRGIGKRKPLYVVSVKDQTRFTGFSNSVRKEKFVKEVRIQSMVWCPETNTSTWIARRNGYIFITGNSLGSVPTGMRSGIGVAELKQADSTSQDDLVDNLEDFLTEVAMKVLKKIAQNYTSYKVIKDLGVREGDEKYFAVIGKKSAAGKSRAGDKLGKPGQVKIGPDWFDVAEIGDDNNIRVTIGSWLGYTKEALQQKVQAYFQIGLIDQSTALKLLEFGDIDSIIQKTRVEAILKRPPQQNPQGGQPVDQYDLALSENDMVLEGKVVTARDAYTLVTPDQDHMVHIAVHQDGLGKGFDEIFGALIEAHQIALESQVGMPQQAAASAPQGQNPMGPGQMGGTGAPVMGGAPMSAQGGGAVGQVPPQAPPGPTAGTQLPQQNLPQVMSQNASQAGQNMSPQNNQ